MKTMGLKLDCKWQRTVTLKQLSVEAFKFTDLDGSVCRHFSVLECNERPWNGASRICRIWCRKAWTSSGSIPPIQWTNHNEVSQNRCMLLEAHKLSMSPWVSEIYYSISNSLDHLDHNILPSHFLITIKHVVIQ